MLAYYLIEGIVLTCKLVIDFNERAVGAEALTYFRCIDLDLLVVNVSLTNIAL